MIAALMGSPANALDPPAGKTLGAKASPGALTKVVQPEYPKEALARRQTGTVDVSGFIDGNEILNDVTFTPGSAESAIFVKPLEEVVPQWRFHAPVGTDCQPSNEVVVTRVSFQIEGDEPRISMTHSRPNPAAGPGPDPPDHMRALHRPAPRYPRLMLRVNREARVYAKAEVDPSGKVTAVQAKLFVTLTRRGSLPPDYPAGRISDFVLATEDAVLEWKFPPAPPDRIGPRSACLTFRFNIQR